MRRNCFFFLNYKHFQNLFIESKGWNDFLSVNVLFSIPFLSEYFLLCKTLLNPLWLLIYLCVFPNFLFRWIKNFIQGYTCVCHHFDRYAHALYLESLFFLAFKPDLWFGFLTSPTVFLYTGWFHPGFLITTSQWQ